MIIQSERIQLVVCARDMNKLEPCLNSSLFWTREKQMKEMKIFMSFSQAPMPFGKETSKDHSSHTNLLNQVVEPGKNFENFSANFATFWRRKQPQISWMEPLSDKFTENHDPGRRENCSETYHFGRFTRPGCSTLPAAHCSDDFDMTGSSSLETFLKDEHYPNNCVI